MCFLFLSQRSWVEVCMLTRTSSCVTQTQSIGRTLSKTHGSIRWWCPPTAVSHVSITQSAQVWKTRKSAFQVSPLPRTLSWLSTYTLCPFRFRIAPITVSSFIQGAFEKWSRIHKQNNLFVVQPDRNVPILCVITALYKNKDYFVSLTLDFRIHHFFHSKLESL